ncbi:hypothetical protein QR680_002828 [Steinernema hermaphroditum]|uniref:GH18 domain-containing protein n=1 Tax=Steinernema hermaphroditum TaxID=289476 RepID=A0AA39H554_9BILA|nr:hypothetical protein QR680_002828 [Steinernema hermaphroditum]
MRLRAWLIAATWLFGATVSASCNFYCFYFPESRNETVNVDVVRNLSCSHLVYGFLEFRRPYWLQGPTDWKYDHGNYKAVADLKKYIPIKILLAVKAESWMDFLDDEFKTSMMVESLFNVAKNFDGYLFDVGSLNMKSEKFLEFLKKIDDTNIKRPNPINIVLSVGARHIGAVGENWRLMEPYFDAVYMIAEDIKAGEDPNVSVHHQALFPSAEIQKGDTISHNAEQLADFGLPRRKIVIGLTTWARAYVPEDPKNAGHLKPSLGWGLRASDKRPRGGRVPLSEFCKLKLTATEVIHNKATSTSSRLDSDGYWYSFNEPGVILKQKLDWIRKGHFGGVGLTSIRGDDEEGTCGEGSMPMHHFVADNFKCSGSHEVRHPSLDCTRLCIARPQKAKRPFKPSDLETDWCSHLVFSSASLKLGGFVDIPSALEVTLERYNSWTSPNKPPVLLSLGAAQDSLTWRTVLATEEHRKLLITRIGRDLSDRQVDGLDISWTSEVLSLADGALLGEFIKDLREGLPNNIIVVSITPQSTFNRVYPMDVLNQYADFVILQGHRFHDPSSAKTGHHSIMFNISSAVTNQTLTLEGFAKTVLSMGKLSPSKIILGFSAEGISMRAADVPVKWEEGIVHDAIIQTYFNLGDLSRLSQEEICEKQKTYEYKFFDEMGVPMMRKDNEMIAFDNARSIRIKTAFASMNNLGGVALYALEMDNVHGECDSKRQYSLLQSIVSAQVCDTCEQKKQAALLKPVMASNQCKESFRVVCSYRIPSLADTDPMPAEKLPLDRCKEIVVEDMVLAADGHVKFADQTATRYMWKLVEARKNFKQHNISIIAAVFCTMSVNEFAEMIDSESGRTTIARNIMRSTRFNSLQGIQFKCNHVLTPSTKKNFAKLLDEINRLYKHPMTRECPYTLSVRIPAWEMSVGRLYDVKMLNSLDAVVLEPFQRHDHRTELISPMFAMEEDERQYSVDNTLKRWLGSGLRESQIILHIPTYGISHQLQNHSETQAGAVTTSTSLLSRKDICHLLNKSTGAKILYDVIASYSTTPDGKWLAFDNIETIKYKVRYAQREGLGGVGLFTLNDEDYDGTSCSAGANVRVCGRVAFGISASHEKLASSSLSPRIAFFYIHTRFGSTWVTQPQHRHRSVLLRTTKAVNAWLGQKVATLIEVSNSIWIISSASASFHHSMDKRIDTISTGYHHLWTQYRKSPILLRLVMHRNECHHSSALNLGHLHAEISIRCQQRKNRGIPHHKCMEPSTLSFAALHTALLNVFLSLFEHPILNPNFALSLS